MKIYVILAFLLLVIPGYANGQMHDSLKIDISNLKRQSYMTDYGIVNCDSNNGSILTALICANRQLQLEDSLLQLQLNKLRSELETLNDSAGIYQLLLSQDIWERYRYAHCYMCIDGGKRLDRIMFMRCAAELTVKRRIDILNLCSY